LTGHGAYSLLGHTLDDAAGEAFDKAARILGLGYPGGPAIEKAAQKGKDILQLPRAWLKGSNDFSFSGIKTALLHQVEQKEIPSTEDAAASFQKAVVDVLVSKTVTVATERNVKMIMLAGGVSANKLLRQQMMEKSPLPVLIPPLVLCTDNAAMVAACGYYQFQRGKASDLSLDVMPDLRIS